LQPQTIDNIMTFGGSFFGDAVFAANYTIYFNPIPVSWATINDDQTAVWVDILQPKVIDTIMAFGNSFFGDASVAADTTIYLNPLPVSWTDIDDTQTANWTEVVQ